jgi:nucleotide-binding universal stress UspA family protein
MMTTKIAPNAIVVGVDGSESSKNALRWAQFIAVSTGSTVHAITAWQEFGAYSLAGAGWTALPTDFDPEADAEKSLAAVIDEVFGAQRPVGLVASVHAGLVAKTLLDASVEAQMLVVGSRGHGGFAGLLLGSVSSACAEHASCPVLVVHGTNPPPVIG